MHFQGYLKRFLQVAEILDFLDDWHRPPVTMLKRKHVFHEKIFVQGRIIVAQYDVSTFCAASIVPWCFWKVRKVLKPVDPLAFLITVLQRFLTSGLGI